MDPLTQQLVQRQLAMGQQDSGSGLPVTPPNIPTRIPPEAKRFSNAQQIQDAYRGGWQPNPILLRAQLGNK